MKKNINYEYLKPKDCQTLDVFAKYLFNDAGGAEKSTFELIKKVLIKSNVSVVLNAVKNKGFGSKKTNIETLKSYGTINEFKVLWSFKNFPAWEYVFNRNTLIKKGASSKSNILWTYGLYAPAYSRKYDNEIFYFIRSETDLGLFNNYNNGIKKILKNIHLMIEFIPLLILKNDIRNLIKKSKVIANSDFMASKLKELFNVDSVVIPPIVNIDPIFKSSVFKKSKKNSIVFVGDSVIKGIQLVYSLAEKLNNENFIIFSRYINKEEMHGNITIKPWVQDNKYLYANAKLVIMPSQWQEAYGRVAREAYLLGLNVLVSNVGGLNEAVDKKRHFIVDEYDNVDAWVRKIKLLIGEKT